MVELAILLAVAVVALAAWDSWRRTLADRAASRDAVAVSDAVSAAAEQARAASSETEALAVRVAVLEKWQRDESLHKLSGGRR